MTDLGAVEYSKKGSGPCLVFVHGSPGIHDGVTGWMDDWVGEGFTVIGISRAGYGRSKALANFEEQADAIASLLTNLGIEKCAILGMSGGGPCSLQFAARHPNICKAVITECAITGSYTHPKEAEMQGGAMKMWLTSIPMIRFMQVMGAKDPLQMAKASLKEMGDYDEAELDRYARAVVDTPSLARRLPQMLEGVGGNALYANGWETFQADL